MNVKVKCIRELEIAYDHENLPAYFVGEIYDADLDWLKKDGKPTTICVYNDRKDEAYLEEGKYFDEYFKIDIKETRKEKLEKINETT